MVVLARQEARRAESADGELAARMCLRRQVAHLEREIAALAASAYPRVHMEGLSPAMRGPRVLGMGELECLRDELAGRLQMLRSLTREQAAEQARNRELLAAMRADPGAYRWLRIANADIGAPGCTVRESLPVLGLVGMLMGWWRVKVSSGCP